MLREYVVSEAMHALGIPTTRSLAVVGDRRAGPRETLLPGAVLARVAGSHLRVGTSSTPRPPATSICCAASPTTRSPATTPTPPRTPTRYLALFEAVIDAQASLVASGCSSASSTA